MFDIVFDFDNRRSRKTYAYIAVSDALLLVASVNSVNSRCSVLFWVGLIILGID